MMFAAPLALAGCLAVAPGATGILASDLAPAIPEFAAIAQSVGLAPAPGVVRVFHLPELRALAARFGIPFTSDRDVCVTRPVAPLDSARLVAAMQAQLPQARIEIVDFSRQPAPAGEIEFSLASLHYSQPQSLWTGSVRYAGNRRFGIWAQIKIHASTPRVIAKHDLKPGESIAAADLALETRGSLPQPEIFCETLEQAAGKAPRVPIRAGSEIRTALLEAPKEVRRGDTVRVTVESGGAQLGFDAQAETSGAVGQSVTVRNPLSSKTFRARVEAKGRVRVIAEQNP